MKIAYSSKQLTFEEMKRSLSCLPRAAECWTGMCYFVKNLTKFLRGLCRILTEKLPVRRIWGIHKACYWWISLENIAAMLLAGCFPAEPVS